MSEQRSAAVSPAVLAQTDQLMFGFMTSRAIAVAAKLGIADLFEEAPRTAEELETRFACELSSA